MTNLPINRPGQDGDPLLAALQQHGPAPGAQWMMDHERESAEHAVATGIYAVWRCTRKDIDFCTRIGPRSMCQCGHRYSEHNLRAMKRSDPRAPRCTQCACPAFRFVPSRPEEVGQWWLPRRRDFDIRTWSAKCKCGHSHMDHGVTYTQSRCRRCGCAAFRSDYACVACDCLGDDHESVFETEAERREARRPVGPNFFPLSELPEYAAHVFPDTAQDAPE